MNLLFPQTPFKSTSLNEEEKSKFVSEVSNYRDELASTKNIPKERLNFISHKLLILESRLGTRVRTEGFKENFQEDLLYRAENFITEAVRKFIDWLKTCFGGASSKDERGDKSAKAAAAAVEKLNNLEELDLSKLNKIFKGSTEEEILHVISRTSGRTFKVISTLNKADAFIKKLTTKVKNGEDITNSTEALLEEVFKPLKIENSSLDNSLKDDSENSDFYCLTFADYYLKDGTNYILEIERGTKLRLKFTKTLPVAPSDRLKKLVLNAQNASDLANKITQTVSPLSSSIDDCNFKKSIDVLTGLLDNLKSSEINTAGELMELKNIFKSMNDFYSYLLEVEDDLIYSINLINAAILRFNEVFDASKQR